MISPTRCLVSIFTIKAIQSLSHGLYAPYKERTSHIFGNVWCPIFGKPRTPLQLHVANMEEKQTENK